MLSLDRRIGEEILIAGGEIRILVISASKTRVRLGISAPRGISIDRAEVHEARARNDDHGNR